MRWIWNEVEADAKNVSDDVVEVMAENIQMLRPEAQAVLKIASCIGATFDKSMVKSLTAETHQNETLDKYLKKLLKQGFIIKMIRQDPIESIIQYGFSHDRIQQVRGV